MKGKPFTPGSLRASLCGKQGQKVVCLTRNTQGQFVGAKTAAKTGKQ